MLPLLLTLGCPAPQTNDTAPAPIEWTYPHDDVLSLHHVQAVGTHNSYHVETAELPEWSYTHAPLGEQLSSQGVRQFELDVYWNEQTLAFDVLHAPVVDAGTTCETLVACVQAMKDWSDLNPAHHPLYTLIEPKSRDDLEAAVLESRVLALEAELLSVWPRERLLTPDLVQRGHSTIREGVEADGWPTMSQTRGTALFTFHSGGGWLDAHLAVGTGVLFQDAYGDTSLDYAAVHSMNNPNNPDIATVVERGHLVRTRADSDTQAARDNDPTQRDAAIASGAHFVSTDFPVPHPETGYVVQIPGGTPSRCNPMSAPDVCTSESLENPEFMR